MKMKNLLLDFNHRAQSLEYFELLQFREQSSPPRLAPEDPEKSSRYFWKFHREIVFANEDYPDWVLRFSGDELEIIIFTRDIPANISFRSIRAGIIHER